MYEQRITRRDPGCIVILLDRSDSMRAKWGTSAMTLAEGAARAINDLLFELCMKALGETGGDVRHHFDIGVVGYGLRPSTRDEGVESAFGSALAGQSLVPLPHIDKNPVGHYQPPSVDAYTTTVPFWITPQHGCRTPMCEAIAVAGADVHDWASSHPRSFPPIVINITDGMVTDSPYEGADLAGWADRLTSIATSDGPALLFNIFLSPSPANPVLLPNSAAGLPEPGPSLFAISSELPAKMVQTAQAQGVAVSAGSRGFAFNANLETLVRFLDIGTRVV